MGRISWFLAGIGLGALAGVLYAPRPGDETLDVIRSKAEAGKEMVADRARQAREQADEWVDRGREVLNQQKDNIRGAYETGKQAYQDATSPKTGTNS